jgi:hypothetical protein
VVPLNPSETPGTGLPAADPQQRLTLAFAPLHKRAFGVAVGLVAGLCVFVVTLIGMLVQHDIAGPGLWLLQQYFYGYSVTFRGALVGMGWGFLVGFVAGWFLAFWRNVIIAVSVFLIRARAELAQTRDFLDHI